MNVAAGELRVALDQLTRVVDILKRADPAFCKSHGEEPVDDEEWDEVLSEAEEYLDEMKDLVRPRTWPQLLEWAVAFVERETQCLAESISVGGVLTVDDELDQDVAEDVAEARAWLTEARQVLA